MGTSQKVGKLPKQKKGKEGSGRFRLRLLHENLYFSPYIQNEDYDL